jgi:PAS domain S-box-containing protein
MPAGELPPQVLDTLTEGCQVIGPDYTYRYLNDAAVRQSRRAREALLGRRMEEVFPGIESTPMFAMLQRCMEERVALRTENEFQYPDGGTGQFELRFEPVPEGVFILSLDVTEWRHGVAEWLRLSTAIEQAAEAMILTSATGEIQYVNPAFELMTGYRREEVLGKNPRILASGKHDAEFYAALWKTLRAGKVWRGQIQNRRKDGAVFTQETTISPVCDDAGTTVSYVGLGRDVTVEVKREADLRQSQKMETIGRLAGGIAHDFNNLLSVIIAYADVVLEELREEDPLREDVKNIRDAGDRAAALTRQLLAFSRKQVLQPAVLDLNGVVEGMTQLVKRLVGENIAIKTLLAPNLRRVRADPAQVEQVIMNLAANARDAMPAGGKLTIETANAELDETYTSAHVAVKPGRYVMLSVSDTGVGMDEGTMSQVFEPFFTTKPVGQGTGLGMATVYGIVKQSGGSIWAYSEPGRGSTFKIYLPEAGGALSPTRLLVEATGKSGTGETVLLVEDEEPVRRIAERILTSEGYRVLVAADGEEAMDIANQAQGKIHLLLTDVVMPKMNGNQLAEKVAERNPRLRVLYMSGYTDDVIVRHGMLKPDTQFIGKPFNSAALRRKVREVLDA